MITEVPRAASSFGFRQAVQPKIGHRYRRTPRPKTGSAAGPSFLQGELTPGAWCPVVAVVRCQDEHRPGAALSLHVDEVIPEWRRWSRRCMVQPTGSKLHQGSADAGAMQMQKSMAFGGGVAARCSSRYPRRGHSAASRHKYQWEQPGQSRSSRRVSRSGIIPRFSLLGSARCLPPCAGKSAPRDFKAWGPESAPP